MPRFQIFFAGWHSMSGTHTLPPTCLPLNVGHPSEVYWIVTDNPQIMTKHFQDSEKFRRGFCSPRAAEACMLTILLLHTDPTVIWPTPYGSLGLICR